MNSANRHSPQQTLLFKIVAFLSHLQIGYLVRSLKNPRFVIFLFTVSAGASALAIITTIAYLTNLPLLFPPLGPSAVILFYMPMSATASPRNLILGHGISLLSGLFSLHLLAMLLPDSSVLDPSVMNYARIIAISLAMGFATAFMILFRCIHPPAAATSLIAAMGFLENAIQAIGLISAVVLLVFEAFFFIRIIGGIPYPYWRFDPRVAIHYKDLSGRSESIKTNWEELSKQIFQHRK